MIIIWVKAGNGLGFNELDQKDCRKYRLNKQPQTQNENRYSNIYRTHMKQTRWEFFCSNYFSIVYKS
jgi:hypothetical protein